MIKTVLGNINENEVTSALCHEHICCYSEYLFMMSGKNYLDKEKLCESAVRELVSLRENYGINLFVDCTAVNIGRDVELLKRVSEKSGVHIVSSTGFYYTRESVLSASSASEIARHMIYDAANTNAGIIKSAVEYGEITGFEKKMLEAAVITHKSTGLPIVLHSNANNGNGGAAADIMTALGAEPQSITVGHLSDTDNLDYVLKIAEKGCNIAFDRICNDTCEEYISKKVYAINVLCEKGFEDSILLSHDELVFSGFDKEPKIREQLRFSFSHKHILPRLDANIADKISRANVIKMLGGKNEKT